MRLILILFASFNLYAQQNLSSPVTVLNTPGGPGELRIRDTTGHFNGIKAATTMSANYEEIWPASNVAGVLTNDGSGVLSWGSGGGGTCPAGATGELQFYNAGSCAGSSNLTWNNSSRQLTVTGISGTAAILVPGSSGYIQSDGGVYSNANVYNGFFSNTDGIAVPAFGVFPVASGQTGGGMDFAEIVYPPSGSTPCYDAYGNLATFPNVLTGAAYATYNAWVNTTVYSQYAIVTYVIPFGVDGCTVSGGCDAAFYSLAGGNVGELPTNASFWAQMGGIVGAGLSDVIVWNGPSPLQGYAGGSPYHVNGTPCNAPPLTNPLNGLNVSSYVFARYGFATDVSSPNAIQIFTGGAQAESYFAGALYYPGTVTHCCGTISAFEHLGGYLALNPTAGVVGGGSGCTSIASCNNPLIPGESLTEGLLYEESTTHHMAIYDSTNWREVAYWNDSPTFGTVTAAEFSSTATGAAISFQTNNTCIQIDGQGDISVACTGDILNNSSTGGFSAPFSAARNVYETLGGFESSCAIGGNIVFSTSNNNYEVTCAGNVTLNNITINGTCTGSGCGGGSDWSIASTNNLYNNAGIYVIAGGGSSAVDDGSHAYLQSKGSASVTGTIQAIVSAAAIGFQTLDPGTHTNNFSVDGYGDISGTGFLHMTGALTGGATTHYLTGGNVGIGTASPAYLLDVNGTINSDQTGSGSGNLAFQTANGNFEVDGQGNISVAGTGSVISIQGSNGGVNVTNDDSLTSIQTVGGMLAGGNVLLGGYKAQLTGFNNFSLLDTQGLFLDNSTPVSVIQMYNGDGTIVFAGHLSGAGTVYTPTVSGTNCSAVSGISDTRGAVSISAGVGTCTVTFSSTLSSIPICIQTGPGGTAFVAYPTTTSFSMLVANSQPQTYHCIL